MRILLTGANGYIGRRLLSALLEQGHEVFCCVRDKNRIPADVVPNASGLLHILEIDFLQPESCRVDLENLDAAYYLIHSMSSGISDFERLEEQSARNFVQLVKPAGVKQIIYLSGIANKQTLSQHLTSRRNVEAILQSSEIPVTVIRAGIIVGSGSASFEIIRDLVEKLPVMIAPRWLKTRHQPVAIRNVIACLTGVLLHKDTLNQSFDIGGSDILTYQEMLEQFAAVRGLKRLILTVPVMTPRLSSYWLYFVTATSYRLAVNLVNSMKIEIIARDNALFQLLGIEPLSYQQAVEQAFYRIEHDSVISSWKDSLISSSAEGSLKDHLQVPVYGCYTDTREVNIGKDGEAVLETIWSIGGNRGWYYANWLWKIRGIIDKLFGGVGLRRGRTNARELLAGGSLDFWRVLIADKTHKRLLLYAEMKLPGEAWLEFKIITTGETATLRQTATFRPKGVLGRAYWYSVLPFHFFVFNGMAKNIARYHTRHRTNG